jgi:hypothetical protein
MPAPPGQRIVPLGKHLFHPLHNGRKRKPVLGLDVKANPVGLDTEASDLEGETEHGFPKDPYEKGGGPGPAEDGLPVIDAGVNLIPNALGKLT